MTYEFIRVERGTAATNPKLRKSTGHPTCHHCKTIISEGQDYYVQHILKDGSDCKFKAVLCAKEECLKSGLIYFERFS